LDNKSFDIRSSCFVRVSSVPLIMVVAESGFLALTSRDTSIIVSRIDQSRLASGSLVSKNLIAGSALLRDVNQCPNCRSAWRHFAIIRSLVSGMCQRSISV